MRHCFEAPSTAQIINDRDGIDQEVSHDPIRLGPGTEKSGTATKSRRQYRLGLRLVVEVPVESTSDDLSHRHSFGGGQLVDSTSLLVGQLDLSSRRHTASLIPR
jgi:hypothetical protein